MPAAVKLKEEYGEDLTVVFVERQGSGLPSSLKMAAKAGWLQVDAVWTSGSFFDSGSRGLPSFILLDAEGNVTMKGSSNSMKSKMEDEIERLVKESKASPKGRPKSVSKIYADLDKGRYAKANSAAFKLMEKETAKGAPTEAVMTAVADIAMAVSQEMVRCTWLLHNGYPSAAKDLWSELKKGVKGDESLTLITDSLAEKFEGDELKAELSLEKALKKLEAPALEGEADGKLRKKLKEFADEHIGTGVGIRARILADNF